jgi:RNA polymerase sigma factor (sigma-70 family)
MNFMNLNLSDIRTLVHVATGRTGTPIRDEDLEQDVALHALSAFRRLDHVAHPRGLLIKIVHDTVRDYWRRRHSFEDIDSIDERFIARAPDFERDLDLRRRLELLERARDFLPPHKRTLLELFYRHDYSIPEIAQLHGKSVSAIKMELLRCRQTLARLVRLLATKKSRRPR